MNTVLALSAAVPRWNLHLILFLSFSLFSVLRSSDGTFKQALNVEWDKLPYNCSTHHDTASSQRPEALSPVLVSQS